jgi:uncharacterized membrane protein
MAKATGKNETASGMQKEGAPARVTGLDRLAVWITERVGTMVFFLIIFTWTVCWLFWNMFAPKNLRFDPYPGFVLWLFISNMIQLFLMPLLMIGQNLLGRGSDERAKRDLAVNVKAEKEIQAIKEQLAIIVSRLDELKAGTGAKKP